MAKKPWVVKFEEELDTLLQHTDLPERVADILQKYPHTGAVKENAAQMVMTDAMLWVAYEAERIVACREDPNEPDPDRPRMDWKANEVIPEEAKRRFKKHFPYGYCV